MIGVFDIFKIGIGPYQFSHRRTNESRQKQFTDDLIARHILTDVTRVVVRCLRLSVVTGKAPHTDIAGIIMGRGGESAGHRRYRRHSVLYPGLANAHGRLLLAMGSMR